jgi:ribonuclease E
MANKMLIDATHAEETRVVVLRGNRVEEFDFESAAKKQLRGNIYLAKVTRVEPSLQAAFVDYGGNRHGFLAFSEIHPDYYQIPVADRQALLAEEADAEAERARGEDRAAERPQRRRRRRMRGNARLAATETSNSDVISEAVTLETTDTVEPAGAAPAATSEAADQLPGEAQSAFAISDIVNSSGVATEPVAAETAATLTHDAPASVSEAESEPSVEDDRGNEEEDEEEEDDDDDDDVEAIGGADVAEEVPERSQRVAPRRYKIQEVIKRRQVLLVQVVKEERGNKGAALTTYLSLAGRYSVLMPNTARGGGISRKITSAEDRRRLKDIAQELEVPEGMGVILRTAGASRTKAEVRRDFEYLMRLWENVAELTLKSQAPMLVYEEGSLVKRAIRDLYNKDIDEITVAGEDGYREAKDFMRMLMPSHAKNVKLYRDEVPLFTRSGIESQLDQMFQPQVQLRSGGYIVLNQTEALVSIDVNSGRATREHNIEDTALKTNLEAAEEIARQLRLRDLAGLIVIDFIDMEEGRNNRAVERRLKECLKQDRARIQVGRISHFGLLEMSRQRIRTSVLESTTEVCPHCNGTGYVRSPASAALQILRMIEEALIRDPTHNLTVRTRTRVALYVLNQKRANLSSLEDRFGVSIGIEADEHLPAGTSFVIDKGELSTRAPVARAATVKIDTVHAADLEEEVDITAEGEGGVGAAPAQGSGSRDNQEGGADNGDAGRRRRRRRRGRREDDSLPDESRREAGGQLQDDAEDADDMGSEDAGQVRAADDDGGRRRRRGRRGGRRNRADRDGSFGGDGDRAPRFDDRGPRREERGPRLDPVTWVQPSDVGLESTSLQRIEIEEPANRSAAAEVEVIPEVGSHPVPAPELESAPSMPRIPDLPELQTPVAPPADDPERPRRAGWWNRQRA